MDTISRVFCSYANEDIEHFEKLSEQLAALRRSGCIEMWSDREIRGGEKWNKAISDALESADVVLMLISPSFIASDYCFDIEMTRALELAETGQTIALPILIRACDWEAMPFAQLQMMPNDRNPIRPIASRPEGDRDEAWRYVARMIRDLLGRYAMPTKAAAVPIRDEKQLSEDTELVLRFLRAWPNWGFNVPRIRNWGGHQPGFEALAHKTNAEITVAVKGLLAAGRVTSFNSKTGSSLYKAR